MVISEPPPAVNSCCRAATLVSKASDLGFLTFVVFLPVTKIPRAQPELSVLPFLTEPGGYEVVCGVG